MYTQLATCNTRIYNSMPSNRIICKPIKQNTTLSTYINTHYDLCLQICICNIYIYINKKYTVLKNLIFILFIKKYIFFTKGNNMLENMTYIHVCHICNKNTSKMLILMYINLDPWKNNNGKTSKYTLKIYNMIYIHYVYLYNI